MTVPHQRSPQQPWPSTVGQRTPAPPQAQHRLVPVTAAAEPSIDRSATMTILRATAYVLTSIASLLFILLVIYGAVRLHQLGEALTFGAG